MAVIIQQVIGSEYGDYWYPSFSGVARSLNFYPVGKEKAEDGVGMLSFGFGKMIVDNDQRSGSHPPTRSGICSISGAPKPHLRRPSMH